MQILLKRAALEENNCYHFFALTSKQFFQTTDSDVESHPKVDPAYTLIF